MPGPTELINSQSALLNVGEPSNVSCEKKGVWETAISEWKVLTPKPEYKKKNEKI